MALAVRKSDKRWLLLAVCLATTQLALASDSAQPLAPGLTLTAEAPVRQMVPSKAPLYDFHPVAKDGHSGEASAFGTIIELTEGWTLHQESLLFGQGLYAGIILGLALYNLVLYLAIQERVYLYYALYVTSFGSLWIARTGFFYQYLWPQHAGWGGKYQPILAACAIVFSVLFVREFLATRAHSPRIDRLLLGIIVLTAMLCLARLFGMPASLALPLALIGMAITLLYAAIAVLAQFRGYRPARFFLLAWMALLMGNVIYILVFLHLLPTTFLTYGSAQAGSALACILLAFALADRVSLLKHEKDEQQSRHTAELQEKVMQRTAELTAAVEKLQTASATDPLTGLNNRRQVDAVVQPWIAELQRERIRNKPGVPRHSLAICLADLDNFKLINDELGHAVGDRVLQAAAEVLRQNVRATGILARWGGEEFLIVDRVTGPRDEALMAERLRRAIINDCPAILLESGPPMSLSLGVVRYPFSESFPDLFDWNQCLALADHALYRAKKTGRNRWQCYRSNELALRKAIRSRGAEEVQRLFRLHSDTAFSLGLIDVVEETPSDVGVR
jgi:diguanylate cyclase (GGDEF)-like protein